MLGKMEVYTFPYGPLDFKNRFRGQADPTFLAAAGNFAFGSYTTAMAGSAVSNFGATAYAQVTFRLGLKAATFMAPDGSGMDKSAAANVPRGNASAGCLKP